MTHGDCQCKDRLCKEHIGQTDCSNPASTRVGRVDMDAIFWFCESCSEDAMTSGVFTIWPKEKS